ncbi:MAG TPA: hypothetical protein VFJ16_31200 [Longimicrobium sp.]|nr:hypothetical protein [Longimicrobium sp.]
MRTILAVLRALADVDWLWHCGSVVLWVLALAILAFAILLILQVLQSC